MTWLRDRQRLALESELASQLKPLDAILRKPAIARVAAALVTDPDHEQSSLEQRTVSLIRISESCIAEAVRLESESSSLLISYQQALDEVERREILRRHLRASQSSRKEKKQDNQAVNRWLDVEALRERYSTQASSCVDELLVCHECVTYVLVHTDQGSTLARNVIRAGLLPILLTQTRPNQRPVIRRSALGVLASLIRLVDPSYRASTLGITAVRRVASFARGQGAARWVQTAALSLFALVAPEGGLFAILRQLLMRQQEEDSMVIRAACVRLLPALTPRERVSITRHALRDPSEHVRQELSRTLASLPEAKSIRPLCHLATRDNAARVRGVALTVLVQRALVDSRALQITLRVLSFSLSNNQPPVVVRVALEAIGQLLFTRHDADLLGLSPQLAALIAEPLTPPTIAEQAAATLRLLDVESNQELSLTTQKLRGLLDGLDEGKSCRVNLELTTPEVLRALRVAARGDHAVALSPLGRGTYRLTRGEPRKLRLWRLWHELRTPMPDKRKGYVHSLARAPYGPYIIPPVAMAEVTPTRVPGERVLHNRVGGWGPFLPRIDDLLTAAWRKEGVTLVTSLGTLVVRGPKSWKAKFRAWLWLSHNYAKASLFRETALEAQESAEQLAYDRLIRSLGYEVHLDPSDAFVRLTPTQGSLSPQLAHIASPLLARYLSGVAGVVSSWPALPPDLVQQFFVNALSPNANEPAQLAVVVWVIVFVYVVRAAAIMQSIVKARNAVPLRIGGWGTRGKSGSERIKAALFHALRYDVVVKTTGCEAMFIHAQRDLPAQEIFIYRPYDKATIWEQRAMLEVAQRLKAQVFLWECMALQPRFVETLIDEWMQDPVTTLTNAYPDHEDIQGPGGEDVARVIGRFCPRGGVTFTTEEQMLPLLKDAARHKGAKLISVEPLEADLLPQDLLDRLPYQEHPRNIALVLALANHFQIDREFALIEIADHVVLDLGVLKTYPEAPYRGRKLVFSNGMSANERAGFMSNWTRLGFDHHDVDRHADTVTVAVVNNRADRVARSRVFAQIIVDDASLHSVVLINGNLGGLLSFITEALDRKLTQLRITGDGPKERVLERAKEHLRWLKIPMAPEALVLSLTRMLQPLGLSPERIDQICTTEPMQQALYEADTVALERLVASALPDETDPERSQLRKDVITHLLQQSRRIGRARQVLREVTTHLDGAEASVDVPFRKAYRELFLDRISILWNTGATGDQVIDFMTNTVPPGSLVRIMGTQNIKGTGLDFVYRWLSIDRVRGALNRLTSQPSTRQDTLAWLGSYNDFGLLDASDALQTLQTVFDRKDPAWSNLEHLVTGVTTRLQQLVLEKKTKLHTVGKADLFSRLAGTVEASIDHLDSARRSARAKRVMDDLFAARVGHGKAALLLREITGRQKGGWLAKDLKHWLKKKKP